MRIIHLVLTILFIAVAPNASRAAEGGRASVHAILIAASKERGPSDPRLAPYEGTLRANLRFESFRFIGESSASVAGGGTATLSLPGGQRIELEGEGAGGKVRVKVRWGGVVVPISPGRPAVLGGQAYGNKGEVSAIIVTAD